MPFYPLTPILAAAACVLVVLYTDGKPLLFGLGVLAVLAVLYYARGPIAALFPERTHTEEMTGDRLLVAVSNPRTAEGLAHLALALAQRADDMSVLFLNIVPLQRRLLPKVAQRFLARIGQRQREMLARVAKEMEARNIPFYTRSHYASDVAQGILNEVTHYGNDKLILMGWPGALTPETLAQHPVRRVLQQAPTNVAVFLDRGLTELRSILVPVGNSHHARLALRVALELAEGSGAEVTAVRCFCGGDSDDMHDDLLALRELIETEFGDVPPELVTRVIAAPSVLEGIHTALAQRPYDLVVMGASMAYAVQSDLFGSLSDQVAETIPCSVLLVRRYERVVMRWLRRTMRHLVGV